MNWPAVASLVVAMVCIWGRPAAAQDYASPAQDYATPAHISYVEGAVVLERDGQLDREPRSMPLLTGDRIRTEGGRVEVLFPDGSALHLDAGTTIDFQSDEVVRLLQGRLRLSIAGPGRNVYYRIDAPSAWVEVHEVGEYRVSVPAAGDVELAVLRGSAELVNELGRTHIRAGEQTFARAGAAPSQPYVFNSAAWDAFDRWSESRRTERLGRSAQYLPPDVRPYAATFDTYGAWRHDPAYGYVWYPRVAHGWRPFFHGRWVTLRPYGWTWVAADPWGWPTHHFGRWGFSAGAWFWIPGRHWGPAWVSWAYTPHYVSWCPLGWNNRPVVQIVNVNIGVGRRFSPWDAWTVVPRRHFGGSFVNVRAIGSVRIDQRVQNTFVIRDRAPEARFAVPRDAAPIRSAGRFAVPRSGADSASVSRPLDSGRRLANPGSAGGERRLPAPARSAGSGSAVRSGDGSAPAAGARAVAREREGQPASEAGWRSRSGAGAAAAPGRAVARDADSSGDASANPAWRSRSTPPAPSAGGRAASGEPDGGATRSPAWRTRSTDTAPSGAGRAVGREGDSGAAQPGASGRTRSAPPARTAAPAPDAPPERRAVQPAGRRPSSEAAPAGAAPSARESAPPSGAVRAVPRRGSEAAPASPQAPSARTPNRTRSSVAQPAGPQPAAPAAQPARARTWSPAPAAQAAPSPAPARTAPAPRSRSESAAGVGRAAPRSAPAPASRSERAAPARSAPAPSTSSVSSPRPSSSAARPASRPAPSAGARSRQPSAEARPSGERGRRRE
jgi:hypothetical protein